MESDYLASFQFILAHGLSLGEFLGLPMGYISPLPLGDNLHSLWCLTYRNYSLKILLLNQTNTHLFSSFHGIFDHPMGSFFLFAKSLVNSYFVAFHLQPQNTFGVFKYINSLFLVVCRWLHKTRIFPPAGKRKGLSHGSW